MRIVRNIFFASLLSLVFIHAAFGFECPQGDGLKMKKIAGVCVQDSGLSEQKIEVILVTVSSWLAFMFGSVAIVVLLVCGFQYLLAAGDDTQAENAKRCIKWSVVGILVAGLAFTITKTIAWLVMGLPPLF